MRTRKWKAWAVVDSSGNLFLRDYRLPLTWLRCTATNDVANYGGCVIRVEVRELPRKRKVKK